MAQLPVHILLVAVVALFYMAGVALALKEGECEGETLF